MKQGTSEILCDDGKNRNIPEVWVQWTLEGIPKTGLVTHEGSVQSSSHFNMYWSAAIMTEVVLCRGPLTMHRPEPSRVCSTLEKTEP